jgi:hypothetical protein
MILQSTEIFSKFIRSERNSDMLDDLAMASLAETKVIIELLDQ